MAMTLREQWTDYQRAVLPADAGPVQEQECRRAFYAGATSILMSLLELPDDASEREHERVVDGWMQEATDFKNAVGTPAENA